MLTQRCQVGCETEDVEGAAETIEAADVFLAFNPKFTPSIDPHERKPVKGSFSPVASLMGKRSAKMSFDVEMTGTAAAGSAIHFADALKACGVDETLVALTSATYAPASDAIPSATLAMYLDGKCYKMWGARGTAKLTLATGKPGIWSFEFAGADFSETDAALLTGTSLEATLPPVFQDATLTLAAYAATVASVTLDLGNTVTLREDANASSGYLSAVITDRKPTLSIDPENVLVATEDFFGTWRAGTTVALSSLHGATAGNKHTLTAPAVQYQGVDLSDRSGVSALSINALLCEDSGDDEWQWQIN